MKNQEHIQIEPQIIEVPFPDDKVNPNAVMKIKNLTDSVLSDLKFAIYNPDKFIFSPNHFNLQPREQKLIRIELKAQVITKPFKEFAYLKAPSPLINKRITLLVGRNNQNNSFVSNNSKIMDDQEPSQLIEIQRKRKIQDEDIDPQSLSNRAYNIAQNKAYQKMRMEKDAYIDTLQVQIQTKKIQCKKFKDQLAGKDRELGIQRRINNELRIENQRLKYQLTECELLITRSQDQIKSECQKRRKEAEQQNILLIEMEEQKRIYELELNKYQIRLSQLESVMRTNAEIAAYESEKRIREEELRKARAQLDTARRQKQNYMYQYELQQSKLGEQNQILMNQIDYYKQQMMHSRLEIERRLSDKQKLASNMQISLDELKTQNQVLIRKKVQLQNALEAANIQLDSLRKRNSPIKNNQYNLEEVASLKEENLMLIERLNTIINKVCPECEEGQRKIEQLQIQIKHKEAQFEMQKSKMKQEEGYNTQELKKQLQHLNQTAMTQIKKLTAQKKKLQKELKTEGDERNRSKSKQQLQSTKLESLENQLAQMKEQLLHVKTLQKSDQRKIGIKNQSKQIQESRTSKSHSLIKDEKVFEELGQLRQLQKIIKIEQKRLEEDTGIMSRQGIFGIVDMFRTIRSKLNTDNQWWRQEQSEYLNEIKGLKLKLVEAQGKEKQNFGVNSSLSLIQGNKKLYEYVQQEMRNQYKKLNETIQLLQQKYQIFKRKMISEFRSKLMDLLLKKDKKQIVKMESLLQKLIQSVYNTSHKQALYSREVKRKLQLRKQNKDLRGKVTQLQLLLHEKRGVCSRDPVKIIVKKQEDLFENIKLSATLMTCQAQNLNIKQQIQILKENNSALLQQHKITLEVLQNREEQISKLKSQVVEIDSLHKQQLTNAVMELQLMKGQFLKISQLQQKVALLSGKEREIQQLKQDLQRKKQLIKSMKQKQKTLNDVIQNTQREMEQHQHSIDRTRTKQQHRLQEMVGEFKQKNKHLKVDLQRKDETIRQLKEDLEKKNAFIASQKMASNGSTGRDKERLQTYVNQIQHLKEQNKKLSDKISELKNSNTKFHNQTDNLKNKISEAQKQLSKTQNQLKNQENEYLIKQKSLQSNIRGIIEMLRRLWRLIEFKVRKISSSIRIQDSFDELVRDHTNVDVLKLMSGFEKMLTFLDE